MSLSGARASRAHERRDDPRGLSRSYRDELGAALERVRLLELDLTQLRAEHRSRAAPREEPRWERVALCVRWLVVGAGVALALALAVAYRPAQPSVTMHTIAHVVPPRTEPAYAGPVEVRSRPMGAEVFVGSTRVGTTPVVLSPSAAHATVRVRYRDRTAVITVPEGATVISHSF